MDTMVSFAKTLVALAACSLAAAASAQATGGMGQSTSGAACAGGSPVGMVLPWTVQTGVTAPTLPGHTIARSGPEPAQAANRASSVELAKSGGSTDATGDGRPSRWEFAIAAIDSAPR